MHLDDERIQRALHGELGTAEAETRRHLADCAACRGLVEAARAEEDRIFALLSSVDHPVPGVDPGKLLVGGGHSVDRWGRMAAAVLVGFGLAGVAYAAPGSPVPAILERVLGIAVDTQGTAPADSSRAPGRTPAGIAVAPAEGLVIRLLPRGGDAGATISWTDDSAVVVRAVEGDATFASDPGRLTVRTSGKARLEILVPRTAARVEVRADTTPVFRKLGDDVVTTLPRDSTGGYTIELRSPPP